MAVDQFLKIAGVDGESEDGTHAKSINVLAWSWGCSQSGTTHLGAGSGAGKVNVQDISVTKYVDSSSNALLKACCNGKHYPDAKLTVRKAGENPLEYIKITMNDLIVTSVSTGGSGGEEMLTENISLNFAKFKYEYTPQKPDGTGGAVKDATWNIPKNVE
jgi:type VI secretion system secreted protein Hcp